MNPRDREAGAGYWSGKSLGADPLWEYLLEGQIAASNPGELERLREFIRTEGPPADLIGPPPTGGEG